MLQTRKIPLSHQFNNARAARNFDEMMRLGQELLEKKPDDAVTALAIARYLTEVARDTDSVPYWRIVYDADPDNLEATYQLFRISERDPRLQALAQSKRDALRGMITTAGRDAQMAPPRHIAICGVSFCGSTLLECLMGSLPDAASIGESTWLSRHRTKDGKNHELSLSDDPSELFLIECSECGTDCQVITHADRKMLSADHRNWYARIAGKLGEPVLISSDKNLLKLIHNDPLLRLDALVVFKSPRQAWRSTLGQLPKGRDAEFYLEACAKYLDAWARSYGAFVDVFDPQGRKVFINFDAFTQAPREMLEMVCAKLGVTFDPEILNRVQLGHAIGGNGKYVQRMQANDYRVQIMELPTPEFPLEHDALIENHTELQRVYGALMDLHRSI